MVNEFLRAKSETKSNALSEKKNDARNESTRVNVMEIPHNYGNGKKMTQREKE